MSRPRGNTSSAHDARFKEQIEGQMARLMTQLADLEEFKDDLEADEYAETLEETKLQLKVSLKA